MSKHNPTMSWWLCTAVLFGLVWSCGIDEHYTGLGDKALPGDPLNPVGQDVIAACPPCECDDAIGADIDPGTLNVGDLTGFAWRFDTLAFSAPLTTALAKGLNDALADQIADQVLNLLLSVTLDDRGNSALTLSVGSGISVGTSFQFDGEPGTLGCVLHGATFDTLTPSSLEVPNGMTSPPVLPIRQLRLGGRLSLDGTMIVSGVLDGVLTRADAEATKLTGVDLASLLEGLGVPPDRDTDADGTNDAWQFVGAFSAVKVTIE